MNAILGNEKISIKCVRNIDIVPGWTKKAEGYDGGYAKLDGEKLQRLFNEPAGNTVK